MRIHVVATAVPAAGQRFRQRYRGPRGFTIIGLENTLDFRSALSIYQLMPPRHPKSARTFLFLLSAAAAIAAAEVVLRFAWPPQTVHHQLFCEHHPVFGWQKKPGFTGFHVGPRRVYRVRETMNSKGIRGPEYPCEKPPGEFRILVLGDSYAEGYTVMFEDLFSEVLKRELNDRAGKAVQVINAGTGGYSTDQELLWFETEGIKYQPDLVILLFCDNDVLFNTLDRYFRGFKPLFQLDNGQLKLTNVPVPPPAPLPVPSAAARLCESSYVCRGIGSLAYRIKRLAGPKDRRASAPEPDHQRLLDWNKATEAEKRNAWDVTKALLARLKKDVEGAGARLLVATVPGNDDVTRGIVSICRKDSIDCVDLTAPFRDEELRLKPQGRKLTYAPYDIHWNADGHRLTAEVLRNHLVTRGYTDAP